MSPGDLGELVKPFVFLDFFEAESFKGAGIPAHPHSGLATHTTLLEGGIVYADSTGKSGSLAAGSVEWMRAGGGVWHWGAPESGQPMRGYQLWIALPAELEHTPAESHYIDAATIPSDGKARVLLGSYGALESPIEHRAAITYLHVKLEAGEAWRYQPAQGHSVAWLAVNGGRLRVSGAILEREMAVFEAGNGAIEIEAEGVTELVIGSAAKHPHELVCGSYSVHTSRAALARGEAGIRAVAERLRATGGLG
jgi:redox-sensitive bicupin YhaK (pirin superfamily)